MKKCITVVFCLLFLYPTLAQELRKADYERAVSFLWSNLANNKVFNLSLQVNWFPDSTGFSYITNSSNDKVFNKFDFKEMKVARLFDHVKLAKLLTDSLKTEIKSTALPFDFVRYINKSNIEFNIRGKGYKLDINTWILKLKMPEHENQMETTSPDGKWIAFSKEHNLFIRSTATGKEKQLSTGGKKNYEYASYYEWGELIEGENGER